MLDYNKESGDDDLIIVFKDNNDNDDIIKVFLSSIDSIAFYEMEGGYAINVSHFAYVIYGDIELFLEKIKIDNRLKSD